MKHDIKYLTCSPKTGIYGYRRDIPPRYRYLFPKNKLQDRKASSKSTSEYKTIDKVSFKTKSISIALREYEAYNAKHERTLALHTGLEKTNDELPQETVRRVTRQLHNNGLLPQTLPKIDALSSIEEMEALKREAEYHRLYESAENYERYLRFQAEKEYDQKNPSDFFGLYPEEIYDHINVEYPDKSLLKGTKGVYAGKQKVDEAKEALSEAMHDDRDIGSGINEETSIAYRLLDGELEIRSTPTLKHIKANYLKNVIARKQMNDKTKRDKEQNLERLINVIANLRNEGLNTEFHTLLEDELRDELELQYPKPQTRMRRLGDLASYINAWNQFNKQETLENPFSSLKTEAKEAINLNDVKSRRFFTPEEFDIYWDSLLNNEADSEVRAAGLLMLFCAGPNSEVFGIERRDVKLNSNIPHLIIRPNSIRLIGKGRLERIVPLFGDVLEVLRTHINSNNFSTDEGTPIFPRLHTMNSKSSTSRLKKHIVNLHPEQKAELVPHSSRKTISIRADQTTLSLGIVQYITGHKAKGSNAIHQKFYRDPAAPNIMLKAYEELYSIKEWGYFEEYDT